MKFAENQQWAKKLGVKTSSLFPSREEVCEAFFKSHILKMNNEFKKLKQASPSLQLEEFKKIIKYQIEKFEVFQKIGITGITESRANFTYNLIKNDKRMIQWVFNDSNFSHVEKLEILQMFKENLMVTSSKKGEWVWELLTEANGPAEISFLYKKLKLSLSQLSETLNPKVIEFFQNTDYLQSLLDAIQNDPSNQSSYLSNLLVLIQTPEAFEVAIPYLDNANGPNCQGKMLNIWSDYFFKPQS